jgi:hypothetical protein
MKRPDLPCLLLALVAFVAVCALFYDNAGNYQPRLGTLQLALACSIGYCGGYFGTKAFTGAIDEGDRSKVALLLGLALGSFASRLLT